MKEKTKVCIMGSMYESLHPYKTYSENIDIDRKYQKSYDYHIQTALSHKTAIFYIFFFTILTRAYIPIQFAVYVEIWG